MLCIRIVGLDHVCVLWILDICQRLASESKKTAIDECLCVQRNRHRVHMKYFSHFFPLVSLLMRKFNAFNLVVHTARVAASIEHGCRTEIAQS